MITRKQLLELGLTVDAINHRRWRGRLHPVWRGVYALGRPELTRVGTWMAAVLACGPDAVLSHRTPAEQARDRLRDQTHIAAGLTCLRFTRAQVRFEPRHVGAVLSAVAERRRALGSRPR